MFDFFIWLIDKCVERRFQSALNHVDEGCYSITFTKSSDLGHKYVKYVGVEWKVIKAFNFHSFNCLASLSSLLFINIKLFMFSCNFNNHSVDLQQFLHCLVRVNCLGQLLKSFNRCSNCLISILLPCCSNTFNACVNLLLSHDRETKQESIHQTFSSFSSSKHLCDENIYQISELNQILIREWLFDHSRSNQQKRSVNFSINQLVIKDQLDKSRIQEESHMMIVCKQILKHNDLDQLCWELIFVILRHDSTFVLFLLQKHV